MSSWLNVNLVDITKPFSCYTYMFEMEKEIAIVYGHELELIIMFQLFIITYSEIYNDQKKKFLFNFLIEKRSVLLALDIVINIPVHYSVSV